MIGNAELTEELVRLLDEYPREARDNRFSSTLRGEMAVMRLLHNSRQKMTAGELSSRLDTLTFTVECDDPYWARLFCQSFLRL